MVIGGFWDEEVTGRDTKGDVMGWTAPAVFTDMVW